MSEAKEFNREIIDDVKFGALFVINRALEKTVIAGTEPEKWSDEDKMKYSLILETQDEILRRIQQTFDQRISK